MAEKNLLNKTLLLLSRSCVLFRNNTGTGWVGKIINRKFGNITIENARPLKAGLTKGSSDLIGWTPVKITPEMVGKTLAIFTAMEAKTGKTTTKPEQQNFINQITRAGGIAFVYHTPGEAAENIEKWKAYQKLKNQ